MVRIALLGISFKALCKHFVEDLAICKCSGLTDLLTYSYVAFQFFVCDTSAAFWIYHTNFLQRFLSCARSVVWAMPLLAKVYINKFLFISFFLVPPETVTEDITNLGSQLGARRGLGSVRGSSNGSSDTGTAGIPDNSVMVNVNTSDTSETTSTNATDDSTSSTSKPGGTGSKSSFSDSLVVTDPTTGISYVNQTVMQCNRNVSRLLAQDAGSVEMDSVVPIFWNRRMFVDDILGQPHQVGGG